jgi:hypothetical protein
MRTKRQNKPKRYASTKKGGKGKQYSKKAKQYSKVKQYSKKAKSVNMRKRRRAVTRRKMRGGKQLMSPEGVAESEAWAKTKEGIKNWQEGIANQSKKEAQMRTNASNSEFWENVQKEIDENNLLQKKYDLEKQAKRQEWITSGMEEKEREYRERQEEVNAAYEEYDRAWFSIYRAGNENPDTFTEEKLENLTTLKEKYKELQMKLNDYLQTEIGEKVKDHFYNNIRYPYNKITAEEDKDKIYIIETRDNSVKAALERKERDNKIKSGETDEEKYERLIKDVLARNFLRDNLTHVSTFGYREFNPYRFDRLDKEYEKDYGIYKDKSVKNHWNYEMWSWGTVQEMTEALTTAIDELYKFINTPEGNVLYNKQMYVGREDKQNKSSDEELITKFIDEKQKKLEKDQRNEYSLAQGKQRQDQFEKSWRLLGKRKILNQEKMDAALGKTNLREMYNKTLNK